MKTPSFAEALTGETITSIVGAEDNSDEVTITCESGAEFHMYHSQDYCEVVQIYKILGTPSVGRVLSCHESDEKPEWCDMTGHSLDDSHTWTVYYFTVMTAAGGSSFAIAWLGESNGYYSEKVSFERITK